MKIETERLYLRELNSDDYESLYAVLADPSIRVSGRCERGDNGFLHYEG